MAFINATTNRLFTRYVKDFLVTDSSNYHKKTHESNNMKHLYSFKFTCDIVNKGMVCNVSAEMKVFLFFEM